MQRRTGWTRIAALLTGCGAVLAMASAARAEEVPKPVDLLRLPAAKVESSTALGGGAGELAALTGRRPGDGRGGGRHARRRRSRSCTGSAARTWRRRACA